MAEVKVITPGLFTTVQDLGRVGFQRFGVPVAGVFDRFSAQVANWLCGNEGPEAVLEITYAGPALQTKVALVVAVTGGDIEVTLAGQTMPLWQSFLWQPSQELKLGSIGKGARAYLAVRGGWDVPVVMGSRSTYTRAAIGGVQGRHLKAGDALHVCQSASAIDTGLVGRRLPYAYRPAMDDEIVLRFLPGPQEDHFEDKALEILTSSVYVVQAASDRMGYRLQGDPLVPLKPDIISDAVPYGAIQVPKDGQPIVMGPDRQTTGGYPKIGTILSWDMDKLAQAKPGSKVTFLAISVQKMQDIGSNLSNYAHKVKSVSQGELKGREFSLRVGESVFYSFVEEI